MSEDKITVKVKTSKEQHEFKVNSNEPVSKLKKDVSIKFKTKVEYICLIFAGKILEDEDTLATHNIQNDLTIHLVIRNASNPINGNLDANSDSKTSIHSLEDSQNSLGDIFDNDLYNQLHRELLGNEGLIIEILNYPVVQRFLHNPEQVEQMMHMMHSNSQFRTLMDSNPEIAHLFNNPQIFRESLELARNPSMMQELIRTSDRAMLNLESIPGGMSALERDFREIHAPIIEAANEQHNPYITSQSSHPTPLENNPQRGVENRTPLPNPWSSENTDSIRSASNNSLSSVLDDDLITSVLDPNSSPELRLILDSPRGLDALFRIREGMKELRKVINEANTSTRNSTISTIQSKSPQYSEHEFERTMPNLINDIQNINFSSGNLYQTQLEQLNAIGFVDEEANIQALVLSSGNLEAAVKWLLENHSPFNENDPNVEE